MKQITLILFSLLSTFLVAEESAVLVTGGAGYIGSHVCKALKDEGFLPVVYDSLISGSKDLVQFGPLIVGDLNDEERLDKAFQKYKFISVVHLAALVSVAESINDPSSYYRANVCGSLALLNCMKKYDVKNIVFASSAAVYGHSCEEFIKETTPANPISPYGHSKKFVETIIQDYSKAYGFNYIILRGFNVAGCAYDSGLDKQKDSNRLCRLVVKALQENSTTFSVFGSEYPTPDGTAVRDYIHVNDMARAYVLGVKFLQDKNQSYILNLGTGTGSSVAEVIRVAEKISGISLDVILAPSRPGEIIRSVADITDLTKVLNFVPEQSDITNIIQNEWDIINNKAS